MPTKKVLILDDEESFTKLLKLSLEKTGRFIVVEVNHPANAMEIVLRESPDILLVDVIMPDTDGYEFVQKLRENDRCRKLPVIFLTAVMDLDVPAGVPEEIRKIPHLHKPATTQAVIDCIEEQFGNETSD